MKRRKIILSTGLLAAAAPAYMSLYANDVFDLYSNHVAVLFDVVRKNQILFPASFVSFSKFKS